MNKIASRLFLFAAVLVAFCAMPSCNTQKSAFPSDPYRGASANPNSYPQKHDKLKSTRAYRTLSPKPSTY
ncbi:MAG: hypothetical protein JST52_07480 [Bacteroidetes bacterium]|nr:hypothetical protein [Bacteroidota bacterium]MBS1738931.1 hypothetical protein [Bacteroidota bacterium]